jgi:hypothetical protein
MGQKLTAHRLIPALQLHIKNADHARTYSALLGFLSKLSDQVARETAQDVFRAILKDFIPSISLAARDKKRIRIDSSAYIPPACLHPDDTIQLVEQCITLDLGLEVRQLFDKLQKLAAEEPTIAMQTFFIPFTGKLYKMVTEQSTSPVPLEIQDSVSMFTDAIFDLYANRCVGLRPMRPVDWRRASYGCGCEKCLQLDSFLSNPSQEESAISAGNEDGVKHLVSRLPRIDQGGWKGEVPEYETQVKSGFILRVRKTMKAWSYAVNIWEKDRDAVQRVFDGVFDDEEKRNSLRERLDRLGEASVNYVLGGLMLFERL